MKAFDWGYKVMGVYRRKNEPDLLKTEPHFVIISWRLPDGDMDTSHCQAAEVVITCKVSSFAVQHFHVQTLLYSCFDF